MVLWKQERFATRKVNQRISKLACTTRFDRDGNKHGPIVFRSPRFLSSHM